MRKLFRKPILLVFPFTLLLFSSFVVVEPKSIHLVMSQGQVMVKIQDTKSDSAILTPDWYLSGLTTLLGDFDRKTTGVFTYDNLGMNIWKDGSGEKISEFHVHLYIDKNDPEDNEDYDPKNIFTGVYSIDGFKITTDVTPTDLRKQMTDKGWRVEDCSLSHNYKFTKKGIYIFFQYNPGETKLEYTAFGLRHF